MIKLIAAVSKNGVIGKNNDLIFRDKQDLQHFKETTMGQWCIMGRKTWESIGSKPLKGRSIDVITNDSTLLTTQWGNPYVDLDTVLNYYEDSPDKDLYVLGGGELYKKMINIADELIISHFNEEVEGDVFFPEISDKIWMVSKSKKYENFTLKTYKRRKL